MDPTQASAPRLPNELLLRMVHFAASPTEKQGRDESYLAAQQTLCRLSLVNRTLAGICRPLAWHHFVSSSENDFIESGLAHLYRTTSIQGFVKDLVWSISWTFNRMSLLILPVLVNLTSLSLTAHETSDLEVPKGITDLLPRLKHLERLELIYYDGFQDPGFSLGAALPSLRSWIVETFSANEAFQDVSHQLGALKSFEGPLQLWVNQVARLEPHSSLGFEVLRFSVELLYTSSPPAGSVVLDAGTAELLRLLRSSPFSTSGPAFRLTGPNEAADNAARAALEPGITEVPHLTISAYRTERYGPQHPYMPVHYLGKDETNAVLPFSAILGSFPNLADLELHNEPLHPPLDSFIDAQSIEDHPSLKQLF
ncbi:hypothetical protein BCR35DRAFT_332451 [Leucosporidium creatinivorum]|uniref:Uncharacterized protein n=1 Tax=Leucosporidium creatinivorum TaxID=106004 RepID=A0A1Y2F2H8_9BASI|nr:hypothetical protein BCR35DRAFT_332451 [Leucosporidium creatinivorum]